MTPDDVTLGEGMSVNVTLMTDDEISDPFTVTISSAGSRESHHL